MLTWIGFVESKLRHVTTKLAKAGPLKRLRNWPFGAAPFCAAAAAAAAGAEAAGRAAEKRAIGASFTAAVRAAALTHVPSRVDALPFMLLTDCLMIHAHTSGAVVFARLLLRV